MATLPKFSNESFTLANRAFPEAWQVPAAGSSPRLVSTQLGTRHSPNGHYGILERAPRQSALMLAARITLAHFSVSSAISFPNSVGESASTVPPRSASRALILGSARPALLTRVLDLIRGAISPGSNAPPGEVFGVIETALRSHFAKEIPA